jgi:HEAT repeat protein
MARTRRLRAASALAALAAVLAFAACAPAENFEKLFADLTNPDAEVRQEAADRIETVVQRNQYQVLVGAMSSPNMLLRANAILQLARMTSPDARTALVDLLAIDRRMMLPFNPVRQRPESEPTDSRIMVAYLIQRTGGDPRAIERLLEGAESEQTGDMLAGTCLAIGALGDPGGIAFLERASRHPETDVVRAAVQALGQFNTPESTAALRAASTHPVMEVRSDVISALSTRQDAQAAEILTTIGRVDPDPQLRASAWQVLSSRPGVEFVPYFIDRLADAPDSVRQTLVDILGRLTGRSLGPKRDAWARYWSSRGPATATR